MYIKLYLLMASVWTLSLMAANHKGFRIYQNMTCDAPVDFIRLDHAAYWSKPDENRKIYYKRILQAVLMGKPKSSARYDDVLTKGSVLLIFYTEKHLSTDLQPALKVLKGAARPDALPINKINNTFIELVKFASRLAAPI